MILPIEIFVVLIWVKALPLFRGGIEIRNQTSNFAHSIEVVPHCTCHLIDHILCCAFINGRFCLEQLRLALLTFNCTNSRVRFNDARKHLVLNVLSCELKLMSEVSSTNEVITQANITVSAQVVLNPVKVCVVSLWEGLKQSDSSKIFMVVSSVVPAKQV